MVPIHAIILSYLILSYLILSSVILILILLSYRFFFFHSFDIYISAQGNSYELTLINFGDNPRLTSLGIHTLCLGNSLKLEELQLGGLEKLKDDAFKHMGRLSNLKILSLSYCDALTDQTLVNLAEQKCIKLRQLDLSSCAVTDEGIRTLAAVCMDMEDLNVGGCTMVTKKAAKYFPTGTDSPNILYIQR